MGIIVDNFAGGGGASTGIELATGRSPDIAVNHDPEAVAMHTANHPSTRHYCEDVFAVDPVAACEGRPVGLAWFSPDCKHFSKAKGGKPVDKKIRGLADVVVTWARAVRPRVIILENVEEFQGWGPLVDGKPDPAQRGVEFQRWRGELVAAGYYVEMRQLRACDYGAPTSRKRLFIIARSDGHPIVWPEPTHGPGRRPYRTAADCIDWSLPCPSIFGRDKPLVEATLRRIARGIQRHVVEAECPFIAPTAAGLASPTLIQVSYGERPGQAPRVPGIDRPIGTIVAGGIKHALVTAFLAKHYGGHEGSGASLSRPMDTITCADHHALVRAFLVKYYGTDQDPQLAEPLHTVTTKDRFGLVTVAGTRYVITDIGMRMLTPRELATAQGFPSSYLLDVASGARRLSKSAQVRMVGNSVCPPVARALVAANYAEGERMAIAA
jgi:DNA (cytosine-5)-methyltransferase 1